MKQCWANTYLFNTDSGFFLYTLHCSRCRKFPYHISSFVGLQRVLLLLTTANIWFLCLKLFSNFNSLHYPKLDRKCGEIHFPGSSFQPMTDDPSFVNTRSCPFRLGEPLRCILWTHFWNFLNKVRLPKSLTKVTVISVCLWLFWG
jgi:hypothetical protein